MTSAERVFCALQCGKPDRTPTMELFIDRSIINALQRGMSYDDFIEWADMDVVTCLTMADDPADIDWVDKPNKVFRDKWGALQAISGEIIPLVTPPARIETDDDLANYNPPDPASAPVLRRAEQLIRRFNGNKAIAVIGECSFAPSQYLRAGLENLMIDYVTRPDFVTKLARIGTDYHVELFRKLVAIGVEIVVLGDDFAGKTGTFMSPEHFERFILPELKIVVKAIHDAGAYCIIHTDGDIWKIMDMLVSTGADMLGPLEWPYMQLDQVRGYAGGAVGAMGNIDVDLLSRGTPAQVRQATEDLLRKMAPHGGHILSSANTISSSVKPENFMAMLEVARSPGL